MQEPGTEARIRTVEVLSMGEKGEAVRYAENKSSLCVILVGTVSDLCPLLWWS